jgi:hypothetical protein
MLIRLLIAGTRKLYPRLLQYGIAHSSVDMIESLEHGFFFM